MDKTRTLPPLVRGRVTKVLEFFVDKIKFFRNILLLTDNFDLVLQVQWWGESLPALVRPKELQVEDRVLKNSQSLESYHCEKYEIKTTSELFESYLKTCEVLELPILEAVESYVIGSAFLRDLINLLKTNNELISMPIFDYSGEEIGEVIIHVNFVEKSPKKTEVEQTENAQLSTYVYLDKNSKQDCDMLSNTEGNFFSVGEKILFYDGRLSQRNHQEDNLYDNMQSQINYFDSKKNERSTKLDSKPSTNISKPLINQKDYKSSAVRKKSSNESLPDIKILSDSSKVLYFGLSKPKTDVKSTKAKVPNKFSSNSIKCRSKISTGQEKNKVKKTIPNFPKKKSDLKEEKKLDSKTSLSEKSEVLSSYKLTDVQSLSSKENSNTKVLDYLLGCDMSKDNEERALDDFKKMSPSHNLVDSISQLCLTPDNDPGRRKHDAKSSVCSKQTNLNYDFNNPIERNYFEKFFVESNPTDFELAEFLNHPENSQKLGTTQTIAKSHIKSPVSSFKNCSKISQVKEATKNDDYLINNMYISDRAKSCGRCKYYKKLSELDTIIESLKHFEQKMIMHEKNSQNADLFSNRNHLPEGS